MDAAAVMQAAICALACGVVLLLVLNEGEDP